MSNKREEGYYWVEFYTGGWEVAYWDSLVQCWQICGVEVTVDDEAFKAIDEQKINRNHQHPEMDKYAIDFYTWAVTRAFNLQEKETLSVDELITLFNQQRQVQRSG